MNATFREVVAARWTAATFAASGFAVVLLQSIAFFRLAGHTFAGQSAFGYSQTVQAVSNAALLPPPFRADTPAGYLELSALEPLAVLFAAWATVSATSTVSRNAIPVAAAYAISVLGAVIATCAGIVVGVASGGGQVDPIRLLEAGLLLVALALAWYGISLVVARISRNATVIAVGLLLALFFVNSLGRVFTQLDWAGWLSPFRYFELSTPLPPGGHFDVGGFAVLMAVAAVGAGGAALIPNRLTPSPSVALASWRASVLSLPVARELYPQRIALSAWWLASAALGVVLVGAARTSMQDVLALPPALSGIHHYVFVFYAELLSGTWLAVATLMTAALAFAFVARWAADDGAGRLEAVLSTPRSRAAVVLERLAALAVAAGAFAAFGGIAVALTSSALSMALDLNHLAGACLLLVLFAVLLGGTGSLLDSTVPRAAAALLGILLVATYLDDQIGEPLGLPTWAQDVSPFRLLGAPLTTGIDARSLALLVLLSLAAGGSSILAMQRRDVGA